MGKCVGESITLPGALDPIDWVIEEILTAAHHGVQEAYSGYEKNFPGRTFLKSFPAPTEESVSEWAPLIRTVSNNAKRENELVRMYWKNGFPLGFMAWALGESIPAVMGRLTACTDIPGLLVEFPAPDAQRAAAELAKASSQLVLTRSALANAESLGFLDALGDRFVLMAPRSLLVSLETEAREAATLAANGRMGFGQGETGLTAYSLEAGHPDLVSHRDRMAELVRWVKEKVRFEPRPLTWLEPRSDSESPTLRDKIGAESWDALELAHHRSRPLYADDLGLRRLDLRNKVVHSFSTATLLLALAEEGKIDSERLGAHLHTLILARQLYVPASVPLLLSALSRVSEIGHSGVATVFGVLASLPTLGEAATMAAKTFRAMVTSPVQILTLRQVVRVALDAMRPGWAVPVIAQEVRREAAAEFRLLPRELREIDRVCGEFVRALEKGALPSGVG